MSKAQWPQGDHLCGKPQNVSREFDSCHRNVRKLTRVREMSWKCRGRSFLGKLFITMICCIAICLENLEVPGNLLEMAGRNPKLQIFRLY